MATPWIQLVIDHNITPPPPLRTALKRLNARVSMRSFDKALATGVSESTDICVVLPSFDRPAETINRFVAAASDRACATLVIPSQPGTHSYKTNESAEWVNPPSPPETPSDRVLNADELAGRIKALCEIRHPLRKMRAELDRLRQNRPSPAPDHRTVDEQIRLAGQIQNDLLAQPMGETAPVSIRSLYVPADFVSGDTYSISRLDEQHFGFSIADAAGHGLPAALLAIMVLHALRGKETINGSCRILDPDEVLTRLNQELYTSNLPQCQFVTALHAVFDRATSQMEWARGGIPYPILIRPGHPPRQIRSNGPLLGAIEQPQFEVVSHRMQAGDLLLFYTDGLEALLLDRNAPRGSDAILNTSWIKQLAAQGPERAFDEARALAAAKLHADWPHDDMTALAIRMISAPGADTPTTIG